MCHLLFKIFYRHYFFQFFKQCHVHSIDSIAYNKKDNFTVPKNLNWIENLILRLSWGSHVTQRPLTISVRLYPPLGLIPFLSRKLSIFQNLFICCWRRSTCWLKSKLNTHFWVAIDAHESFCTKRNNKMLSVFWCV